MHFHQIFHVYHDTGLHITFDVTYKQTPSVTNKNFIVHIYESYMKCSDMSNVKRLCIGLHTNDNKVQKHSTVNTVWPPMLQN